MAIDTPSLLGSADAIDTAADQVVTLSGAIQANALALCAVVLVIDGADPSAPTSVVGGGVTWTLEETHIWRANIGTTFIYRAMDASPSGTTVTVDLVETVDNTIVTVVEITGVDTGGTNGSAAVIQSLSALDTNSSNIGVAMATLGDTTNNGFIAWGHGQRGNVARTWSPDSTHSFTELASSEINNVAAGGSAVGSHIQFKIGLATGSPTVTSEGSGSNTQLGISCFEIKAAASGVNAGMLRRKRASSQTF